MAYTFFHRYIYKRTKLARTACFDYCFVFFVGHLKRRFTLRLLSATRWIKGDWNTSISKRITGLWSSCTSLVVINNDRFYIVSFTTHQSYIKVLMVFLHYTLINKHKSWPKYFLSTTYYFNLSNKTPMGRYYNTIQKGVEKLKRNHCVKTTL